MSKTIWILMLFFSNIIFGQEFEKSIYDSLVGNKKYNKELRIRTLKSVLNEYKLTRIYQDSSKNWFLETYMSNGEKNKYIIFEELDEFDKTITKDSIYLVTTEKVSFRNLDKKFYKTWLELLTTNILDLPNLEKIIEIKSKSFGPNDGIYYIIEMKDQNKFNRVTIGNPYHYIDEFKKIDEFEYLNNFLKLAEKITKYNNGYK